MDRAPARDLTEEEITAYERDGVACLRGIYSPQWVATLTDVLDEFYASETPQLPGVSATFKEAHFYWLENDVVRDFVLYGPSARVAQQAMRSKAINFFYDQIFIKGAKTSDPTPWHHDMTFWPLTGNQIATLWTSVDAVNAETSALEFIAGSHKWRNRWKPVAIGGAIVSEEANLEALPDIDADRSKFDILSWALEPGDALLFHAKTVHGARGNNSPNKMRRAISTRWCGDDVRYDRVQGMMPLPRKTGLERGQVLSGEMFPQVLPTLDRAAVANRLKGPLHPDPECMAEAMEQFARAEMAPI